MGNSEYNHSCLNFQVYNRLHKSYLSRYHCNDGGHCTRSHIIARHKCGFCCLPEQSCYPYQEKSRWSSHTGSFSLLAVKFKHGCGSKSFCFPFVLKFQVQAKKSHGMLNSLGWWRRVGPSTTTALQFHVYFILQWSKSARMHSKTALIFRSKLCNESKVKCSL